MNKLIKKVLFMVLAAAFSLILLNNTADQVFADEQAYGAGTGNSVGGDPTSVLSTRSVGWVAIPVDQIASYAPSATVTPDGSISWNGVHTQHTDIGATVLDGAASSGVVYVYGAIAQKNGTVNGVHYQAGQLITPIDVGTSADAAWKLPQYGGYARQSPYALDFNMVKSIFDAEVAAGRMNRADAYNFLNGQLGAFNLGSGGAAGGWYDPTNPYDIIMPDIPSIPEPPRTAPIPDCGDGLNWGDTNAQVKVTNLTTGTGWVTNDYVWARPGDSIKFANSYCYAARAVRGGPGSSDMPYANVEDNRFTVTASPSSLYYFGEHFQSDTQANVTYTATGHDPNPTTAFTPTINYFDVTGNWKFQNYSPHNTANSAYLYTCQIFDFSPFFTQYAFQIPGAAASCPAAALTGNGSGYANVGGDISQSITYNRVTAWRIYKHWENHGICAGCDHYDGGGCLHDDQGEKPRDAYNTLSARNLNYGSPYTSLAQALSGAGDWGRLEKFNDNVQHDPQGRGSSVCNDWYGCASNAWAHQYPNPRVGQPIYGVTGWQPIATPPYQQPIYGIVGYEPPYLTESCDSCRQNLPAYVTSFAGHVWGYPTYDYSTDHQDLGQAGATAGVHIPYNFMTSAESHISGDANGIVYVGEDVSSTFSVSILPRIHAQVHPNESYATIVPAEIRAVEFIVREDTPVGAMAGSSNASGRDPCSYFAGYMIDPGDCPTVWSVGGPLNPEGRYSGQNYIGYGSNRTVPDLEKYPVGSKYCVAVGISISDSHSQPDSTAPVSGMQNFSGWRISGASCRTIAKKPNFQVWNGGIYTNGSIDVSVSTKQLGATLGGQFNPTRSFGSWAEYYVVAAGNVVNFSSGAAPGYFGYSGNSLGLSGGAATNITNCDATKMTVSNDTCNTGITGNSGIRNASQDIILERIRSRYTDATRTSETSDAGERLSNGARYVKKNGNFSISQFVNAIANATSIDDRDERYCAIGANTSVALKRCEGPIDEESKQTTSNYASNTLVIHVTGVLTIDRNICNGNGTCTSSNSTSGTGIIRLGVNNSQYFSSLYSLPQILLIADGGVQINPNVNQIDAWIITNGNINTCTGFSVGSGTERQCKSTLIINGPVFANSVSLNRTGGAYPGVGNFGTNDVLQKNISNGGSITPAEIFNLRPDVLYWAYSQAQRFTQATVTYTRELAPRY